MSKPIAPTQSIAAPVFITASQRKTLTIDANALRGMVSGMIGQPDQTMIRPSMLHQTKDGAKAALGASVTPVSFVSGLMFLTACYANGQGKADSLKQGLPPVAAFAVDHAFGLVAIGKGITAQALADTIVSAVTATAALPSKVKAKQGAVSAPLVIPNGATVQGEAIRTQEVRNVDAASGRAINHSLAFGHEQHENEIRQADMAIHYNAIGLQADAIARVKELADSAPAFSVAGVSETVGAALSRLSDDAQVTLLRALAARHGFTLEAIRKVA